MDASRLRQIALVDWDFVLNDDVAAAGLHWYPGSFVPGLPAALIEALTTRGDSVIDPYGGVGTTSIAAISRGRSAICCDINPVATMSSFVGVSLLALRVGAPELFYVVFEQLQLLVDATTNVQPSLSLSGRSLVRSIDRYIESIFGPLAETNCESVDSRTARAGGSKKSGTSE